MGHDGNPRPESRPAGIDILHAESSGGSGKPGHRTLFFPAIIQVLV